MEKYIINGGRKLIGEIEISPAKNACLPIIASAIIFNGKVLLKNAPNILDVMVMAEIIKDLGGEFNYSNKGLLIKTSNISRYSPSSEICIKARASFFIVGALLTRFRMGIVSLPGGCNFGLRPVDVHIDALSQLGVKSEFLDNRVFFDGANMKSGSVYLKYPSVGATVNVICACVGLLGESIIYNCAKEPEIVDLCNFLKCCGAKIDGIGSSVIKITGIKILNEVNIEYKPIQDRIEAGTFLFAAMATKGEIIFNYSDVCHICSAIKLLEKMGTKVYYDGKTMALKSPLVVKPIKVIADVFPAFPTDLQSPLCALCAYINGESIICDNVFKNRFAFVKQLIDIGVEATIKDNSALIKGKSENNSCNAQALDLRAGAGLIIYALGAKGESIVTDIDIIKRGYEKLDEKLKNIGADIHCIST